MKRIFLYLSIVCTVLMVACHDDDSFTASPTATLSFSTDSVKMDTVFSTVGSRTYDFWVYNRSRKGVRLKSVRLAQGNQTGFRVNVDGSYLDNSTGAVVNDLEVRSHDSIRVFVELTAPENYLNEPLIIEDDLVFTLESGVEQRMPLRGCAWDAIIYKDEIRISHDTIIESRKPIVLMQGLRVDSTATLVLKGTSLYFHDHAGLDVYGTLVADSSVFRGDRLDRMFSYLPYDRVSGQWKGIHIHDSSYGNRFTASEIRNAENGIVCDSTTFIPRKLRLYMKNSVVHNCAGVGLQTFNSYVGLLYCQFTNTQGDCAAFYGGAVIMDRCTLAQFYPFKADRGAALRFANYYNGNPYPLEAMNVTNSIVTGYADDVVMGDAHENDSITAFSYYFENSLLRTPVVKDAKDVPDTINFVSVRWETPKDSIQGKQHFRLIDEENLRYDFHLDSLSTAHGLGCYD